ncbi:MAG: hypothetical protein AAB434_09790 [Planctomycetota bacterium]
MTQAPADGRSSASWLARLKATVACLAFGTAAGTVASLILVAALFTLARFRAEGMLQPPVTILAMVATGLVAQVVVVRAAERRAPRVATALSLVAAWIGLGAGEAMAAVHAERGIEAFARGDVVSIIGGALGAAMGVWMGASLIGWRVKPAAARAQSVPEPEVRRPLVALVKAGPSAARPYAGPTRTKVSLKAIEHVCPICADDANPIRREGPNVWVCPTCGAWHHVDCWRNNGQACGVLGQH